jgi:hypothetical protein
MMAARHDRALTPELRKDPRRLKDVLGAIRSYPGAPPVRVFGEFLLFSGRRPKELRQLRRADVELQRAVYAVEGHKSAASTEDFIYAPLREHLVELLTRHMQQLASHLYGDARDLVVFPAFYMGYQRTVYECQHL